MTEVRSLNSSTINTVAYDDNKLILYVEYKSGAKYKYTNVPAEIYANLCIVPSPGNYVQRIGKVYACEKYS